jgi:hypothetical protein
MSSTNRSCGGALRLLSKVATLVLSTSFLVSSVSAQFTPDIVSGSGSAYIDGKGLYVLGGTTTSDSAATVATPKAFMIDLSTTWSVASPAFKSLPDGPSAWGSGSSISSDGKSWFSLVNNAGYVYDIDGGAWSTATPNDNNIILDTPLKAVTDPDSGLIYIPNAYQDPKTGEIAMLRVDLKAKTFKSVSMMDTLRGVTFYSATWSAAMGRIVYYSTWADGVYSYSPSKGWKKENTKGDVPPPRVDACLVSAYDGHKIVLFGGYSRLYSKSLNDIYILDVDTMTWTKGPDAGSSNQRDSAACASSKNYFIAWGGVVNYVDKDAMPDKAALVFDIQSSNWTQQYDGTSARVVQRYVAPRNSVPGILGGILGTLAVLFAIMGYIIYRKRTKRSRVRDAEKAGEDDSKWFIKAMSPSNIKNIKAKVMRGSS